MDFFYVLNYIICQVYFTLFSFLSFFFFSELRLISETYNSMFDLDVYVKKLMNAKRRVMLVNNILQNAQVFTVF